MQSNMQPEQKPLRSGGNGLWRRAARSGPAPEGGEDARITIRQAVPSPRPAPGPAAECFEIIPATPPPLRQAGGSGLATLERCGPGGEIIEGQESGFAITTRPAGQELLEARAMALRDTIDIFCKEHDARDSSKAGYRRALRQFENWIIGENITVPNSKHITAYKLKMVAEGKTDKTVNTYLAAVRVFFTWAESMHLCHNIAAGVKGQKGCRDDNKSKDCLTPDQAIDLPNSIDRTTLEGKRNYSLLLLAIRTGVRAIELARADVGDIRQDLDKLGNSWPVLYIQGKGRSSKNRRVLLKPKVFAALNEYIGARQAITPETPLFVSMSKRNRNQRMTTRSISRIAKESMRGIGINSKRITLHSLRHTHGTVATMAGAPIDSTQKTLGHRDLRTTQIYLENLNRFDDSSETFVEDYLDAREAKRGGAIYHEEPAAAPEAAAAVA